MLAVCKPHGIATHPALGTTSGTLGNFVSYYYQSQGCPLPFRPVSRLDKETAGLLIIAKHKLAHHSLSQQQKDGSFQKKYLALVEGIPTEKKGEINLKVKSIDGIPISQKGAAITILSASATSIPYMLLGADLPEAR